MNKYYYIPVNDENQFKTLLDNWIASQPESSFVVVNGVYKETTETIDETDSTISNKDILGNVTPIKKGHQ